MAVDLSDLVESLKREVNPPGTDYFPDASDTEFLGNLIDGFWEAVLDGLISGYTVDDDGLVTPVSGSTDMARDVQQIIVFYAGFRILRNVLRNIQTTFRAKAGPVEYETQQSASTLKDLLADLSNRRKLLLDRLSDMGAIPTYYADAVVEREARWWYDGGWS